MASVDANGGSHLPQPKSKPLTHYHSFFRELLSWRDPRASGIAYASIVAFIFAARYLDVLRWALKISWMTLGVTISAEVLGKLVLNNGLTSQLRPRRFYTVPRETLDSLIGDFHELVNFFVIEGQRILFAENIPASVAALVAAFISYYLVKLVPLWVLSIIATTITFLVPLIYTTNQELIDEQIHQASELINAQTAQVREAAGKQFDQVSALGKQYAGDYTGKVQDLLKGKTPSRQIIEKPVQPAPAAAPAPVAPAPVPVLAKEPEIKYPVVPTEEPVVAEKKVQESVPVVPVLDKEEPLAVN